MRAALIALVLTAGTTGQASADSCGDLIDKVVAASGARMVSRTLDFAELSAADGMGMTLACGELSAVGAQFKGASLPEGYFALFGRAAQAVTGIEAAAIEAAGRAALDQAARTRHSHVDAGKALVTCSLVQTATGPVTACAAIEKDER